MATLAVLEGNRKRAGNRHTRVTMGPRASRMKNLSPYSGRSRTFMGRDGNLRAPMGSLWSKVKSVGKSVAKVAVAPVTMTYSVTKATANATVTAVKHPSITNFANIA